jgi:hypothetical protein
MENIGLYRLKKENHAQNTSHNYLYQVTTTSGVNIQEEIMHNSALSNPNIDRNSQQHDGCRRVHKNERQKRSINKFGNGQFFYQCR